MGNNSTNYAKRVIRHQKVIGRKEFSLLWHKYSEPGGKRISSKNAKKFLKDFVDAVKIKYDPLLAKKLLSEGDPTMTGYLDEEQFTNLFFNTTQIAAKHELYLSASLAARQKKLLKENDRDAGSGSLPSSIPLENHNHENHNTANNNNNNNSNNFCKSIRTHLPHNPTPNNAIIILPKERPKRRFIKKPIELFEVDAISDISSHFASEYEDSNALSDLTGSHSLLQLGDRIELPSIDLFTHSS
jgi:hypothetical protein